MANFQALKSPGFCLILLALLVCTSQAQAQEVYERNQPVGAVGGPPDPDPFYFYPTPGTSATEMVWADNKQLEAEPGILGFYVHGFTAGTQSFTGHLLDSGLNPIDGTEFSGATNVDAVQIDLAETTRFSGLYITLGTDAEQSLQGYMFNWIASLTVVEGDAVGNQPPIADAGRPISRTAGVSFKFDGTRSEDPDGRIVRYDWDPGDGTAILEDAGATPDYVYAAAGTYNITLTVTDDQGAVSSDSNTATIARDNEPPVADAGGEPPIGVGTYVGTVGVPVQFDGSRSRDDLGIVRYTWDFGDAQNSGAEGVAPEFAYDFAGDYTVTLTVYDDEGEFGTDWAVASISGGNQPPVADAGPPVAGTSGVPVRFDGTASGDPDGTIVRYDWRWGDGTSDEDVGPAPQHTYVVPRDYTVTLIVVGEDGVSDSDTTTASIDSGAVPPRADAGGPYQGTTGASIEFDGTDSNDFDGAIVQYDWNFGDGNNGTGPTASNTYTAAGDYTVTLTVTDDDALTSTDTQQVTIADGNEPPRADANGPYDGVAGVAVDFDGSDSSDPDGSIALYEWSFGDDGTATGSNPSHTYAAPGNYTVTLTVTDGDGVTDGTVTGAAIAATNQPPVADAGGPYTGAAAVAVDLDGSASSDADGAVVAWDWDFGDNRTGSGETTSHIYAAAGTYTVKLTVTDDDGDTSAVAFSTVTVDSSNSPPSADAGGPYVSKVGVPVRFDGNASRDPFGRIVRYDWDFGDGTAVAEGAGPAPLHIYAATGAYDVVLTVTDNEGASASAATKAIIGDGINLPPTADPGELYTGEAGTSVLFDGSASSDPDGAIDRYDWSFGDVSTGTGASTVHTYAESGIYQVTLTVTDDGGKTDTQTAIAVIGANQPPTAEAGGPYPGIVNQPIRFFGGGSEDGNGSIVQVAWDFGDNETSRRLNPAHTYTAPGPYTVTLTVTDDEGATDSDTAQVFIGDGLRNPPTAEAGGPYVGLAGVPETFDGTGSSDADGSITDYAWTFGDSGTGTGEMPEYSYLTGGMYSVTLQVTDDDGLPAADGARALIGEFSEPPTADVNGPYRGTVGVPVAFDASDSGDADGRIVQYDWDFGDRESVGNAGRRPTHVYSRSGQYLVTLTVTDNSGETDTDVAIVTIGVGNLPPVADAGASVATVIGREVSFDGSGSFDLGGTITAYEWSFGDEATATGENPDHSYSEPGFYRVTLTVTDDEGGKDSDSTLARVVTPDINVPPVRPVLRFPADESDIDLEGRDSVLLSWTRSIDPNGDDVSFDVFLCTRPDPVAACFSVPVASLDTPDQGTAFYASVIPTGGSLQSDARINGLLAAALAPVLLMGIAWRPRKRTILLALLVIAIASFVGCDGDDNDGPASAEVEFLVTNLEQDRTYYWAVVARDDEGAESFSEVSSFTTR